MPGALAAAAAVAVLEAQGVKVDPELASIAYGRAHLGETGRLRLVKLEGDIVVLDDSYNANPPSMASSIAVASGIAQRRNSRLVLVLGEMRELGELSEREHRLLGTRLGGVSQLVAVAGDAKWLHESAVTARVRSEFCATAELAAECVESILKPRDVVLVKGSRGVKLETVVQRLVSRKGRAA
jgi:UDP-N-acetylmuramoyl-tripeptide--D-alanyl-D-alanine ligase